MFLVHKVVSRYVEAGTKWTPLKEGVTDVSLLAKIVVVTEPEISCSTISEGDSVENFFEEEKGIGLLINRGQITFAGASDVFTTFDEYGNKVQERGVESLYQEHATSGLTPHAKQMLGGVVKSEQDIAFAIRNRRKSMKDSYRFNATPFNEFAVKNPKVGALFTVLQDYGASQEVDIDNHLRHYDPATKSLLVDSQEAENIDTVSALSIELDIKNYIFYRGKFYKIDKSEHVEPTEEQYRDRRVHLGDSVSVDDFLNLDDPLKKDPSKRKRLVNDIYHAKPFKSENVVKLRKK